MRLGILFRQPPSRVDAVEYVVGHLESEIKPFVVVFDPGAQGEVVVIRYGREFRGPIAHAAKSGGVRPFVRRQHSIDLRRGTKPRSERWFPWDDGAVPDDLQSLAAGLHDVG